MRIFNFFLIVLGLTFAACGSPETGMQTEAANTTPWKLVNAESQVEFISVKKGTIVETHSFGTLRGIIDKYDVATIAIELDSVETNIDIRNERMRLHLFETKEHPLAIISALLDKADFAFMNIGDRKYMDIPMSIYLHGKGVPVDIELIVTRLDDNKILVESRTPFILDVATFDLQDGVEKLRELAKLPSITPEVPVMFSLVFERA